MRARATALDRGADGPARPRGRRTRTASWRPTRRSSTGRPRLDRRARAGDAARREGADRGVQRPRRARAHPQGDDLARPDRERRAAPGAAVAGPRARPRGRRARAPRATRDRARVDGGGRPLAQRRGPGDDPRQAVRHRRRRAAASRSSGSRTCSSRYPLRGVKGPMGTSQDMLDLLDGDEDRLAELERRVAAHLGFDRVLDSVGQVYPRSLDFDVVSALVQLVAAPVQPGDHDPADGRPRAGDRGLRRGPGRLQRDAPQDEHPLVRARQRPGRRAPRPPVDGVRAGRRPVERGRRLLLRRTPDRAAGRLLRHRRAVPDLPHRARRVRRLPGGDPARARPLPAVPDHHQGADGGGPRAASDARPRTRRSRSTPSRWRWTCARAAPTTTSSTGSPPTRGSASTGADIAALVSDPIEFTGAARSQTQAVVRRVEALVARHPEAAAYSPGAIL